MSNQLYTNVAVHGNKILFRGIIDGKRRNVRYDFSPSIFVPCSEESEFKTLHGENLVEMPFDTMRDAKEFINKYKDVDNFKLYGNNKWEYPFIYNRFPDHINWDVSQINIAPLDIEVDSVGGYATPDDPYQPINAIAVELRGKMYVLGVPSEGWAGKYENPNANVTYLEFKTEVEMLIKFYDLWSVDYPDVITGWFVKEFDIPYLITRTQKLLGEDYAKKISPWKYFYKRNFAGKFGREATVYVISGIATLDYMDLYKKYDAKGQSQESYSLDNIAFVVLGKRKVDYSEYGNLAQLYRENYQKFIDYNLDDMRLINDLENKLGLIKLALTLAYDSKVNYEDVFSQVRMWTVMIHNELMGKSVVAPLKQDAAMSFSDYAGAYVKDPTPGRYEWVVGFDLTSLYPHLIMQYNISPEMIVEPEDYTQAMKDILAQNVSIERLLNEEIDTSGLVGVTLTPNGQFFRTSKQGFLGEMMETMFIDRKKYNKQKAVYKDQLEAAKKAGQKDTQELEGLVVRYNNLQAVKKVCLNSAYGALGNVYFFLYDTRQAEGITSSGQLSIRWVARDVNIYLNKVLKTTGVDYVIASDTDSIYLNLSQLVGMAFDKKATLDKPRVVDFLDTVCKDRITPVINQSFERLARYVNAYAQKMDMKREAIADVGIWTAKKRYILNVWDMEGVRYTKPDIKISGLEAVKSSTPRACRAKIKETIGIMLSGTNDDVIEFIDKFRQEFKTLPLEDISFPRSVNGINKDINDKGIPIQVRGAILYNKLVEQLDLKSKYEMIKDGEKIKFIYLKEPNRYQSHVMAFLKKMPKEFDLDKYIDYNTQYDKSYVEPIKAILNAIGWKTEKKFSLEDFFT